MRSGSATLIHPLRQSRTHIRSFASGFNPLKNLRKRHAATGQSSWRAGRSFLNGQPARGPLFQIWPVPNPEASSRQKTSTSKSSPSRMNGPTSTSAPERSGVVSNRLKRSRVCGTRRGSNGNAARTSGESARSPRPSMLFTTCPSDTLTGCLGLAWMDRRATREWLRDVDHLRMGRLRRNRMHSR